MQASIAWKNGHWLPVDQVQLALDDWGVLQGAMLVDRLRTMGLHPLDLELHLRRLAMNCEVVGVEVDIALIGDILLTCATRNRDAFGGNDFSLIVLCTPGLSHGRSPSTDTSTIIVYAQPLNWQAMAHWYRQGQALIVAANRNVPAECWSPQLKTRSRLHYYLADLQARRSGGPHAGAVLQNTRGELTETSAANLIIVDVHGIICSPPEQDVLCGVNLKRTLRLAQSAGFAILRRPIYWDDIAAAREVVLTGTSACLWPVERIGEIEFQDSAVRPVYLELCQRWIADVGLDYVQQATNLDKSATNGLTAGIR